MPVDAVVVVVGVVVVVVAASSSIDRLSLLVFLSGLDLSQVSSSGS